ncbi:MFS transporter [Candidatus Micrarchaeota archaeon]|nr:MFS transporter [Candidatus Micrarchaeota archaeon]
MIRKRYGKSKKYSIVDGASYSAMSGLVDTYIPAFLVELGSSNFLIGALSALPQFASALSQFFIIPIMKRFNTRKGLNVLFALFQALTILIIALLALSNLNPNFIAVTTVIIYSFYFMFVTFPHPAWGSWMNDLVPQKERAEFFSVRQKFSNTTLFLSTAIGGLALEFFAGFNMFLGFGIIFLAGLLFRLVSTLSLSRMKEPSRDMKKIKELNLSYILKEDPAKLNLLIYLGLSMFAVKLAAPFFVVFSLEILNFTLLDYGLLMTASIITRVFTLSYWAKIIDRFGNKTCLYATGLMISLAPILWILFPNFIALLFVQIFTGFVWGGFELVSLNYVLSSEKADKEPSFVALYNTMNGFFLGLGSITGGLFLTVFSSFTFFGLTSISLLFILSGILRFIPAFIMIPRMKEAMHIKPFNHRNILRRIIVFYPAQGIISKLTHAFNFIETEGKKTEKDLKKTSSLM